MTSTTDNHNIEGTDDKIINDSGHHSPTKAYKWDEIPNDNGIGKGDELEGDVFEEKCSKADLKEKPEHKELRDWKILSRT